MQGLIKVIRFIISIVLLTVSLYASEGLDAFKAKDYKKAFEIWTIEANNGEAKAQNSLSYLYFNALGTKLDNKKALYWLNKAALQNNVNAQYDLGMMYLMGQKVKQDKKTAAFWLEQAAEAHHADASYNVALMYYQGDGVDINVSKSAKLLEQAAKQGHIKAAQSISRVYMQLLEFDKAIDWLIKDSARGDSEADYLLGEIYCGYERYSQAKKWTARAIKASYPQAQELWDRYELDKY